MHIAIKAVIRVGLLLLAVMSAQAATNLAVVVGKDSKIEALTLAELGKLAKGTTHSLPDGSNFMLVMKDPGGDDMAAAVRKIFGMSAAEVKQLAAKLNAGARGRPYIQFVADDAALLKTVAVVPGAVGLVDVYAINSSVKVTRVDGKLPFDVGYVLKGN